MMIDTIVEQLTVASIAPRSLIVIWFSRHELAVKRQVLISRRSKLPALAGPGLQYSSSDFVRLDASRGLCTARKPEFRRTTALHSVNFYTSRDPLFRCKLIVMLESLHFSISIPAATMYERRREKKYRLCSVRKSIKTLQ